MAKLSDIVLPRFDKDILADDEAVMDIEMVERRNIIYQNEERSLAVFTVEVKQANGQSAGRGEIAFGLNGRENFVRHFANGGKTIEGVRLIREKARNGFTLWRFIDADEPYDETPPKGNRK